MSRRQSTASLNSWLPALLVAGAVVVFGLAVLFVAGGSGGSDSPPPAAGRQDDTPAAGGPAVFDLSRVKGGMLPGFVATADEKAQMAYQYAMDNRETIMWMPCYCGCGGHSGHKSAYNCFVKDSAAGAPVEFDDHGAGCTMCVGIVLDTKRLSEEGWSLGDIRSYIDEKYGATGGEATDTPLPPA